MTEEFLEVGGLNDQIVPIEVQTEPIVEPAPEPTDVVAEPTEEEVIDNPYNEDLPSQSAPR